jgi:tRNA threonylcarbamoyladenosine biosynthesis protein TsaE
MEGDYLLRDASETQALGQSFGVKVTAPTVVHLQGDLGSGKTTFIQGLVRGLGADVAVLSPTYTLVEEYTTEKGQVHHLDLYRIAGAGEAESLGLRDRCGSDDIVLIEWPDRGGQAVPRPNWTVSLEYLDTGRSASIVKT